MSSASAFSWLYLTIVGLTIDAPTAPLQVEHSEYRLSIILVATRVEAQGILERLDAGDSFADLALTHSLALSREVGGDIGFIEPENLMEELGAAALRLELGAHSGVLETTSGYFIISKTDERLVVSSEAADPRFTWLVLVPIGLLLALSYRQPRWRRVTALAGGALIGIGIGFGGVVGIQTVEESFALAVFIGPIGILTGLLTGVVVVLLKADIDKVGFVAVAGIAVGVALAFAAARSADFGRILVNLDFGLPLGIVVGGYPLRYLRTRRQRNAE